MYANLKALRKSLKMTQKEFAETLGIPYSTYNGYEVGIRKPRSDFWIKVSDTYGVTIDYLMGYSDDPHSLRVDKRAKEKSPIAEESATGDVITLEESDKLLVQLGFIKEGEDLSDRDLAFLEHIIALVDDYFKNR